MSREKRDNVAIKNINIVILTNIEEGVLGTKKRIRKKFRNQTYDRWQETKQEFIKDLFKQKEKRL
jgi:hypothetical protein